MTNNTLNMKVSISVEVTDHEGNVLMNETKLLSESLCHSVLEGRKLLDNIKVNHTMDKPGGNGGAPILKPGYPSNIRMDTPNPTSYPPSPGPARPRRK